jgi:hypothetical protein
MEEIIDYLILEFHDKHQLTVKVKHKIHEGYQLHGGVSTRWDGLLGLPAYMQAVIKFRKQ